MNNDTDFTAAANPVVSWDIYGKSGNPVRTTQRQGMIEASAKSAMRSAGSRIGSALMRSVLGSIPRK